MVIHRLYEECGEKKAVEWPLTPGVILQLRLNAPMPELRLGDVIDDWCIKCRRLTNHAIVSIVGGKAAKVRCRTCYHDHDYRHEEPPPSKKEQKKAALFNEVLASMNPDAAAAPVVESEQEQETATIADPESAASEAPESAPSSDEEAPALAAEPATSEPATAQAASEQTPAQSRRNRWKKVRSNG